MSPRVVSDQQSARTVTDLCEMIMVTTQCLPMIGRCGQRLAAMRQRLRQMKIRYGEPRERAREEVTAAKGPLKGPLGNAWELLRIETVHLL